MTKDEQIYLLGLRQSIQGLESTEAWVQTELAEQRLKLAALERRAGGASLPLRIERPMAALEPAPVKKQRKGYAKNNYWDKMSPEERSIEVKRRLSMRTSRKKKRHASPEGREVISAAQKARWAKTKRQPTVKMALDNKLTLSERLKLHPRDKRSPKHAEWLETMRQAQLKRWGNMTKAQKSARQAAMRVPHQAKVNGVATL